MLTNYIVLVFMIDLVNILFHGVCIICHSILYSMYCNRAHLLRVFVNALKQNLWIQSKISFSYHKITKLLYLQRLKNTHALLNHLVLGVFYIFKAWQRKLVVFAIETVSNQLKSRIFFCGTRTKKNHKLRLLPKNKLAFITNFFGVAKVI